MILPKRIREIIAEQEALVAGIDPKHAIQLQALARRVARDLEKQLRRVVPGGYTAAETRTKLAAMRALVDLIGTKFGLGVGRELRAVHRAGAGSWRSALIKQLQALAAEGLLPRDVAPALRTIEAANLLDPGLLSLRKKSARSYGTEAIKTMRASLAKGALGGETVIQTADRMASEMRDVFGADNWRAERIVRTEHSFALHRRQHLDMSESLGEADEWRKQLVAVWDSRTGDDSKFVDGQVRKINENFDDNIGNSYMYPPNRPNDRETVIYLPLSVVGTV